MARPDSGSLRAWLTRCLSLVLVGGGVAAISVVTASPAQAAPAHTCTNTTCTLKYSTVGDDIWIVPDGVTSATFTVSGAQGAKPSVGTSSATGGRGAEVDGTLTVAPGQAFSISVGGAGGADGTGGVNGGGTTNDPGRPVGGGGGGYSSVSTGGSDLIVAGGGGGGGAGDIGPAGPGGAGGRVGVAGGDVPDATGGEGGSESGGGQAGTTGCDPYTGTDPSDGASHLGGNGSGLGGGGGGGFYGGGGGTEGGCGGIGSGGGGGSSHVDASVTAASFTTGARSGDGQLVISYANPVTAVDDAYSTPRGQTLRVPAPGLLANDTYPEGSYVAPGWSGHGPVHGTVTINLDGSFTYTPNAGFTGTDSFGYLVKSLDNNYATADVTITVQAVAHTVTFEPENGDPAFTQTVDDGSTANEPTAPSRQGYTFTGWFTAATGGTRWDFSTPVTHDTTLYAQWKSDTETVRFVPHNGEPTFTEIVDHGEPVTEPTTPTRSGWVFDGWYTAAIGGTAWDFGTPVTHGLTLHAQWTSVSVDPGTVAQGGSITVTGKGYWPGEKVVARLHSDPLRLGTYRADARGTVTFTTAVPASFPGGDHRVSLTGVTSARRASAPLQITAVAPPVSDDDGPVLPNAGSDIGLMVPGLGLLLLLLGTATIVLGHRRRTKS
jgi:uncharacterized repeat protein (TIGR02543 family)